MEEIKIKEILEKHYRDYHVNHSTVPERFHEEFIATMLHDFIGKDGNNYNPTVSAIKDIVEQVLELAAEYSSMNIDGGSVGYITVDYKDGNEVRKTVTINKESITNVAKLINYES